MACGFPQTECGDFVDPEVITFFACCLMIALVGRQLLIFFLISKCKTVQFDLDDSEVLTLCFHD